MKAVQLAYPVLCLATDGSIVLVRHPEEMGRCNAVAYWRNRYHEGLTVIDADATRWTVEQSRLVAPASWLGRSAARLFNGRLKVDLDFVREGASDLEEVIRIVEQWLELDPDFWEAVEDRDAWKVRVRACESVEELVGMFE